MYRLYRSYPSADPEATQGLDDLCDNPSFSTTTDRADKSRRWWSSLFPAVNATKDNLYHPFLNATVCHLMTWFYSGSTMKSVGELDALVNTVLLADNFDLLDLHNFSAARELKRMDSAEAAFATEGGWKESSVEFPLPRAGGTTEKEAPVCRVSGIWHRDLVEVIRAAFEDPSASSFHYVPFQSFWQPAWDGPPERVYSELYNSDAFIETHEKLQQQPPEPDCNLERVVAALMLWSDSTHLTNFGYASLWPIYLFFGNQSKYSRAKPSDFAAHHLAYIPLVCLLFYIY